MIQLAKSIARKLPLFVVLLIIVEIVWTNTLVRSGQEVTGIDLEIANLREENEILAQRVASASALMTIAHRAKDQGFVVPDKSQYVMMGEPVPVALVP